VLIVGTDEAARRGGSDRGPHRLSELRRLAFVPGTRAVEREVRLLECSERRRLRRTICKALRRHTRAGPRRHPPAPARQRPEVIGAALTAKAEGKGHRRIAQTLGRPGVHGAGLAARLLGHG